MHVVRIMVFSFFGLEIFSGSFHKSSSTFSLKLSTSRLVRLVTDIGNLPVKRLYDMSSIRRDFSVEKSGSVPVRYRKLIFSSSKREQLMML
uniref:Uncharacterized protein n=1 Tax=Rhizophora mucronata TaxID=61149 RepID=A0A2P2NZJ5_RHIMU